MDREEVAALAVQRFMSAMRRVLIECLGEDPARVSTHPGRMLKRVETIRDEWEAPPAVQRAAGQVAAYLRHALEEVTAAALADRPPPGESIEVPLDALGVLTAWLEAELADLARLRRRAGQG